MVITNVIIIAHPAAAATAAKSLQSCPTVRPHRRQPTRDSPGKNTGVGAIAFSNA